MRKHLEGGFFVFVPPAFPANPVFGAAMADSGPASAYAFRDGMHVLKLQPGASAFSLALPGSPISALVLKIGRA